MEIKKIEIKFMKRDGFSSRSLEGVKHDKVLPWLSIVQSVEGSYDIAIGKNAKKSTDEGGFFIAPSGVSQSITHHNSTSSEKISCRWIFIDATVNGVYRPDAVFDFPTILPKAKIADMNDCFNELFSEEDIFSQYISCYKILKIIFSVAVPKRDAEGRTIHFAADYIKEHFSEKILVSDIAEHSNTSESNLYAAFKRNFGISPIAYLNNYRLSMAAEYLADSELSVNRIAEAVGFSDPLYFSKAFRRAYSISPREYRRQRRHG